MMNLRLSGLCLMQKRKVLEIKECKKAAKPENWEIALPCGARQQLVVRR